MGARASLLVSDYSGRRIVVTGDTGFKGSWLCAWLASMGATVTGLALEPPTEPNLFNCLGLQDRIRHVAVDVRDGERLTSEIGVAAPTLVFHLAAKALVRRAYAEPRETFETNVMGTVNLLEAVRKTPSVEAVVVVTSDKCYENLETGGPFKETDPLGGLDPYAASKAAAEIVTSAYRASFFGSGPAIATVRAGNVIGGGDWAVDRIIPDSVRALESGEPIEVRNPDAVRPWQHVLEPLSGYLHLGARLLVDRNLAGAWNFGPLDAGDEKPVRWVVDAFLREWGKGSWTTPVSQDGQVYEAKRLSLDSSKAREQLGWMPVWGASEAVRRTAAWYREYYRAPARAEMLVDDELDSYQRDAGTAGLPWALSEDKLPR